MDADSESHQWEWPESLALHSIEGSGACMLCRRNISPETEETWGFSICGDCKFLFLEDLESPFESHRQSRSIRNRSTSFENLASADNIFSRSMMDFMSEDQPNVSFRGDNSQRSSSRTTPNGSRRWLRVPSETESFELDSSYAGSESNFSFGESRNFHSEIDAVSFSAYGAESDISVDGRSFLDTDLFPQLGNGSDFDSDTDIDPMHTGGLQQWDLEDDTDDDEWETDNEAVETSEEPQTSDSLISRLSERNSNITLRRTPEGIVNLRIMERRQAYISNVLANLEETDLPPQVGSIEDYLEAADFEAFLNRIAGSETSRQGAPPAAESFLRNMPHIVITEENQREQYDLACAICKDQMFLGTEANQLPCSHIYHSYCIKPWLSVRNSCPLCRFELPTDDFEYEEKKQRQYNVVQLQQQYVNDDNSSEITEEGTEFTLQVPNPEACPDIYEYGRENRRGWLYLAAPVASMVGLALVFWLGNPMSSRGAVGLANPRNLQPPNQHINIYSLIIPSNGRGDNQRRWWSSLF